MKHALCIALAVGLAAVGTALAADDVCVSPAVANVLASKGEGARAASRQLGQLCKVVSLEPKPSGAVSLMDVLKLAFADGPRPRGDRLKPPPPPGMPTGLVVARGGQVVLDFTSVWSEVPTALELEGPQVRIRQRPPGSGTVALSASQLQPGATYRWTLATRQQTYDGTFSPADAETTNRVQKRLQKLEGLSDNRVTLLALEAAIYDDEELFASRDQAIAELRRELGKP